MQGFAPGLDGHYDPRDRLAAYYRALADQHLAGDRDIGSRAEFGARRERAREAFRDAVGGLPERPADLGAETAGVEERDGYRVERVVFESHRDHHVTANCYVPDDDGPYPAVLFCCGHVPTAKGDPENQRACAALAANGVAALAVDPVEQGERTQYPDADASDPHLHSGVFAHSYAGQQAYWAGASVARYLLHDARCALDYLAGRADVDADRLAAAGTSGGGVQAQWLALVDDRLAAVVACCSVTTWRAWLDTGKAMDYGDTYPGALPAGLRYDDFLTGIAPAPAFVGATRSDFFPVEGVDAACERAQRAYDALGASDQFEYALQDGQHASVWAFRDDALPFLCDALDAGGYEPVEPSVGEPAATHCTPDGSVLDAFDGERTLTDLVAASVERDTPAADAPTDPATVRERVTDRFDLDRPRCARNPRFVREREGEERELSVRHAFFYSERDPDIVVAGVLVSDPDASGTPAVVCYEDGTEELAARADEVAALAREHGTAFVFDPRGVGAVAQRELPTWYAVGPNDDTEVYGTEFTLSHWAVLCGRSVFGDRVFDVTRAAAFLREQTASDSVALVGEGVGAAHATYAAAADPAVSALSVRDLGPSFRERATTAEHEFDPRLTAVDVLDCDLPHALAALRERGCRVDRE
jgi:dienelactone hydrolase